MAVENANYNDYDSYNQTHEYVTIGGVIQLPVAQRTSATVLIQLHGGYGKRIVRFNAKRSGRPPVIPLPETSGDTLLNNVIVPSLPRPNEQAGGYDWSVSGEYVFAQNTLRVPGTNNFPTALFPFANPIQTIAQNAVLNGGSYNPIATSNAVVDLNGGSYLWPFTDFPPIFTAETLS